MVLHAPAIALSARIALLAGVSGACLGWPAAPAWIRLLGAVTLLLVLPGWGVERWLLGTAPARPWWRLGVGMTAPFVLHGVIATLAAPLGVGVVGAAALAAGLGAAAGLLARRPLVSAPAGSAPRAGREHWQILGAVAAIAVWLATCPPELSLRSDIYAHVAAVRACLERDQIFPEHEFYAAGEPEPPDPRFGTAHALYAAAARLGGVPPLYAWKAAVAALPVLWMVATALLTVTICRTSIGRLLGALAWWGSFGGSYYDPLRVAAFPQWLGMSLVAVALAILLDEQSRERGRLHWWAALTLAATAALHALTFLVSGWLLLAALSVAPRDRRRSFALALLRFGLLAVPVVLVRFLVSHGNENPIHQLPFYPLQWQPGLYSTRPEYLLAWFFPLGLAAFGLFPWLWKRSLSPHPARWLAVASVSSLIWLCVPWLLTPTLPVLGFLPLRFVIAVFFPLAWGLWADGAGQGAAWSRSRRALLVTVALLAAAGLASRLWHARQGGAAVFVQSRAWTEIASAIDRLDPRSTVLLADPYTMLAARATTRVPIVAVPEGRSSPRDARALERLRDTWTLMSPSTGAAVTDSLLDRYRVTHVLLNHSFEQDLLGFEYAVAVAAFAGERARFAGNPQRFRPVADADGFALYEVVPGAATADRDSTPPCLRPLPEGLGPAARLHDGFVVAHSEIVPADPSSARPAQAHLLLAYTGIGPAPYREIILRADRVPSPVPDTLQPIGKPVRKLLEFAGRRRYRARWTAVPAQSTCPTFLLDGSAGRDGLSLDVALVPPPALAAGTYAISAQVAGYSEFMALSPWDYLRDRDTYSGPVIGRIVVGPQTPDSPAAGLDVSPTR